MSGEHSPPSFASGDGSLAAVMKSRRTTHDFRPDTPPRELVLEAIEHARWAPNHHRTEPWRFYLLSRALGERVAALNAELVREKRGEAAAEAKLRRWRSQPGWLVVTCRRSPDPVREREDYAACCCAVQNLMLFLWQARVGVKWSTGEVVRTARFGALLGLDLAQEFVVGLFWYGYPQSVPVQHRRPLAEIVRELD